MKYKITPDTTAKDFIKIIQALEDEIWQLKMRLAICQENKKEDK